MLIFGLWVNLPIEDNSFSGKIYLPPKAWCPASPVQRQEKGGEGFPPGNFSCCLRFTQKLAK